ncbi:hypothetical protein GQ457_01G034740 [Hibiscus cannabinus]
MEEYSKNYGHQHPLLLLSTEDEFISNHSGVSAECSRCGDKVSAPCFVCAEDCGFYLDKVCADAPLELHHPFHQDHPLLLMQNSPYSYRGWTCNFCHEKGKKFVYHCSCSLDFHIKCALFTFNIAENNFKELQHVALHPPLISTYKGDEPVEDVRKCFGCWEPLTNYAYFSPDCGFYLHKQCAELPLKVNMCHRKHPLVLQFKGHRFSCEICQTNRERVTGLVYCCSPCKFDFHIECASPPPIIEDKRHQQPFTLFWRQVPFICDACGTEGNHVAYTHGTYSIIVHKKCISLPRIIQSKWHDNRLFHTYFLGKEDFRTFDCIICHEEVNANHGGYSCSKCSVTLHVNCALKDKDLYYAVESDDEESLDISVNSITEVLEWNDAGEATVVQHCKHIHRLKLSDRVGALKNKCCDGCLLPISTSFYYCLQCDFFLHKVCAELPKVKHVWHHSCPRPLLLTSDEIFRCEKCDYVSKAFAYKCEECPTYICLRCVIALIPSARTCLGHEHPLLFYFDRKGKCNACGHDSGDEGVFRCKECGLVLDHYCFSLPITVEDKCDEHLLSLTHHDNKSYSESHYCDICERERDPKLWFYHCATCSTSVHVDCVLGRYPFMRPGSIYEKEDHPNPLTFVKKRYYYPDCFECGKRCEGLAVECTKSGYIAHWECVAPYSEWCSFR